MADAAYVDSSVQAAPKAYTLAQSQELQVKAFRAAIDGSAAASSFLPTLQLIAPSGAVMWESAPTTPVAAGGSADCSWFPGGDLETAGGSGSGAGLTVLYDSGYLGADQASIDTGAGGIAAGHSCLLIIGYFRTSNAVGNDNLVLVLNNDASANYAISRIQASGASVAGSSFSGLSAATIASIPGANAPANYFGSVHGTIAAYDNTQNFKSGSFTSEGMSTTAANSVESVYGFTYQSTAAISQLAVKSQTGGVNLKAGSRLIVYGTG